MVQYNEKYHIIQVNWGWNPADQSEFMLFVEWCWLVGWYFWKYFNTHLKPAHLSIYTYCTIRTTTQPTHKHWAVGKDVLCEEETTGTVYHRSEWLIRNRLLYFFIYLLIYEPVFRHPPLRCIHVMAWSTSPFPLPSKYLVKPWSQLLSSKRCDVLLSQLVASMLGSNTLLKTNVSFCSHSAYPTLYLNN